MVDEKSKDEHFTNETIMRTLFGEGVNSLSRDEIMDPKEEHRIFMEVFYGNSVVDASNHTVASPTMDFQLEKDSQPRSPRDDHERSVLISYSSMKESLGEASHPGNVYLNELQETHHRAGSDLYNGNLKRMKLSPSEQLNLIYERHCFGLSDASHDKVEMNQVRSSSIVPVQHPPGLQESLCHNLENCCEGNSYDNCLYKEQGDVDDNCNMDDNIPLNDESKSHDLHYASAKSVTSPISQESSVSGLLIVGATVHPAKKPEMLTFKKHSKRDSIISNSCTMDFVSKKPLTRDLPDCLRSHAHRLLMDTGWRIEPRVRSDRAKLAFYYIGPKEKRGITALSQAWKLCGQRLLNAADKESDDNGRQWTNIDAFWNDLADTLIYIEKNIQLEENSISLLQRWKILDPYVAVVCINRNISVLREGRAVKAVNSVTYILSEKNSIATKGESLASPSSGSESCLDQNSLIDQQNDDNTSESPPTFNQMPSECVISREVSAGASSKSGIEISPFDDPGVRKGTSISFFQKASVPCDSNTELLVETNMYKRKPVEKDKEGGKKGEHKISPNCKLSGKHPQKVASKFHIHASDLSACLSLTDSMITDEETKKDPSVYKQESDYGLITFGMQSKKVDTVDDSTCKELNSTGNSILTGKKALKKSKKISEIGATKTIDLCDRKLPDSSDILAFEKFDNHFKHPDSREESQAACCQSTSSLIIKENGSAEDCSPTYTLEQVTESGNKAAKQQSEESNKKQTVSVCTDDAPIASFLHKDKDGAKMYNRKKNRCNSRLLKPKTFSNLGKSLPSSSKMLEHEHADSEDCINFTSETKNNGIESKMKFENDENFTTSGVSQGCLENKKVAKLKRLKARKKSGQKRPLGFRIDDDDLLIAAIIKNKDFGSCGMNLPSKIGNPYSKTLKKSESKKGGCKLLPRATGKGGKLSKEGKGVNLGARTVLCWLIERGVLSLKDVMQYRNPKNNAVVKDGRITLNGILCSCCTKIYSISDFKAHSGYKLQKPSANLFLQSGRSYTLCQLQAWSHEYKTRKGSMKVMDIEELDQNDDTCGVCGDGGELICCDGCPSTYHQLCLPIQDLPEGSWYCHNCICKSCGEAANYLEASTSVDTLECLQCEHKYHAVCISGKEITCDEVKSDTWFCGKNCQEVYFGLRSRVGLVNHLDDGFSWTILRCNHDDQKVHSAQKIALMAECNTKLAIALTIMEECFLPMVDPRTGINMIPHVLYNWGSSFTRLNYQGFYTVILEKGDTLVAVASMRIHGTTAAEMPLIATCSEHRRKGMCRRLMDAVEKMLKSFQVRMLVLSAIPSLVETWTLGFGFKLMEDDKRKQLNDINLMLLPGTTLLMKNLEEVRESGTTSHLRENKLINVDGFGEDGNIITAQQDAENVKNNSNAEAILAGNTTLVENFNEQQEALEITLSCPTLSASRLNNHDMVNSSKFLCLDDSCSSEEHEKVSMADANNFSIDSSLGSVCQLASDSRASDISSSKRSSAGTDDVKQEVTMFNDDFVLHKEEPNPGALSCYNEKRGRC